MSVDDSRQSSDRLRFFATVPRPCSYLENRDAISIFADPDATLTQSIYDQLARFGFRRSGNDLYVPSCPQCSRCIPVRVPVSEFQQSRNQRRIWNRNRDLTSTLTAAEYREEHYQLYARYLASRHPGGGMDNPTPAEYVQFLTSDWSTTQFLEFRLNQRLLAVSVTDFLADGLSAVYTFFAPEANRRSIGTYAILAQIELAREQNRKWLYLGYWIPESRKMSYKSRFRPLQALRNGRWMHLQDAEFENTDE